MPHSTPTCTTKRLPMRAGWAVSCAGLGVQRRIVSNPRAKTGWDSLTDSELKVVSLVTQGATNRSVAQRLTRHASHGESPSAHCVRQARDNSRAELSKLMDGADQPTN